MIDKKLLNPSDLPQNILNAIRDEFEKMPLIMQKRVEADLAQRKGDYIGALRIRQQIESFFSAAVAQYIRDAANKYEKIDMRKVGMPKEDLMEVVRLTVTLMMAIDILDSCIRDIDDTIHRTDRDLSYELYDDIRATAKMAKEKLLFFSKNTYYLDKAFWGDIVDNMYEMMKRKAKSIMRKTEKENKGRFLKDLVEEKK